MQPPTPRFTVLKHLTYEGERFYIFDTLTQDIIAHGLPLEEARQRAATENGQGVK